ncbi:MAG: peptidylprolyl isomerase [Bacteroidota bacterium]
MNIKLKLLYISLLIISALGAQGQEAILLKVDEQPVLASEFLRVYNKNLDLVKDDSQKDIDTYLELFINYQLKLAEARRLGLDNDAKYKREFQNYKRQLTKNYLSESKVTEALVQEAYDRMSYDVNAVHILVKLDANVTDTLSPYNTLLDYRKRVLEEGFEAVKADVHNGQTIFAEDLGYFSAFKMVYDFETMAYKTEVGEVSMPFRTDFGYHIVKVMDKRPSRGTMTAAHIMVALKQKDSLLDPEQRINEIYKKLNQGEDFESLAKQFSDDKSSARKGGQLASFKSGQLSSVTFEDVAFELKGDGDISKPFKTQYGWHIVKRINKKDIEPFKEAKPLLENRVKRDSRSKLINSAMVYELKSKYSIKEDSEFMSYFQTIVPDTYFMRSWNVPDDFTAEKVILSINDTNYDYSAFGKHLKSVQRKYVNKRIPVKTLLKKEYEAFFENKVLQYREDNLELENEEFANILKEYRDGLLLFDLMEKEVWNKAAQDSVGLENFYSKNSGSYIWKDRVELIMASSAKEFVIKDVAKSLQSNSVEEIKVKVNTEGQQNVIFTTGTYNVDDSKLPEDLEVKEGISKVYFHNNLYHVVNITKVLPSRIKTLEEAKGNVINDYQEEIEADWIADIKSRFKVEVDDKVLKAIKVEVGK